MSVIIFVIWYNGNWQLTYFHIISIWILFNHCYDIRCSLFAHCVTARFRLCFHILSIYIFMNQFDDLTLYSPTHACLCLWCVCFVVLCVCVAFMNEYVLPSCVEYKVMNGEGDYGCFAVVWLEIDTPKFYRLWEKIPKSKNPFAPSGEKQPQHPPRPYTPRYTTPPTASSAAAVRPSHSPGEAATSIATTTPHSPLQCSQAV